MKFAQVGNLPQVRVASPLPLPLVRSLGWFVFGSAPVLAGLVLTASGALAQQATSTSSPAASPEAAQLAAATSHLLFVDPVLGDDRRGDGTLRSPFRSITRALQSARSNTTLLLAAGTYRAETGEQFPLRLPPGVTLQADPTTAGRSVIIRGGGTLTSPAGGSRNVTILSAQPNRVVGIEVVNPNPRGEGLRIDLEGNLVGRDTTTPPSPTAAPPAARRPQTTRTVPVSTTPVSTASEFPSPSPARSQPTEDPTNLDGLFITSFVRPSQPTRTVSRSLQPATRTAARPTPARAVNIPVPPPDAQPPVASTVAVRSNSTVAAPRADRSTQGAIEIPVPPPESSGPTPVASRRSASPLPTVAAGTTRPAAPPRQYNLLPVPNGDVPLGNTGSLPRIPVSRNWSPGSSIAARVPTSLRYRVLVLAEQESTQERVRSLVPEAFITSYNGRTAMQLGAFSTRDNAEEAARMFSQNGLQTVVQEMN